MTTTVTFDGVDLTGTGSMVNFPSGYATVMDIPTSTINTPSRSGAISINSSPNSVSMPASYTILSGGRTEYLIIRHKQSVIGDLVITVGVVVTTIEQVKLRSVSKAAPLGGGAIQCSLLFELLTT